MKPEERPTAAEMASKAGNGLECHHCGCKDWRVYYTRPKQGFIMRRRICRHCGRFLTTYEKEA